MVLSTRTGAFLMARGLAVLLLMLAAASLLAFVASIGGAMSMKIGIRPTYLEPIVQSSVMFLLAGVMWRNAGKMLKPAGGKSSGRPLDPRGLLRPALFGIALFVALSYLGYVVNFGLAQWFPVADPSLLRITSPELPSNGSIITFVIAVIALPFLAGFPRGKVARVLAYPRLEVDDP